MRTTAVLLVPALLVACTSAPPYPAYAIEDDAEAIAQVVVMDVTLQDVIRAGRPRVERVTPDNYLRVLVPLRNIDDEPIQVLAQMEFLDEQRVALSDLTNRQVVQIPSGGTHHFEALSRDPRAADFVLRLGWDK
ncbi:MAG: hypothetical protein AB7O97_02140 [Planctomycetota bacterium]